MFISDFIEYVLVSFLAIGSGVAQEAPPTSLPGAVSVWDGSWGFVRRRIHGLVLLPTAAVAGLVVFTGRRDRMSMAVVAGAIATAGLLVVAVVSPGILNPVRAYAALELVLAVLIAVAAITAREHDAPGSVSVRAAVGVLVIVVVAQTGSALFTLDSPGEARTYLTQSEIEGKSFATEYTGTDAAIASDWFHADQSVDPTNGHADRARWKSVETALYNGQIPPDDGDYTALRSDVTVYRSYGEYSGRWRLTYDPERGLDAADDRIYTTGDVIVYRSTPGDGETEVETSEE